MLAFLRKDLLHHKWQTLLHVLGLAVVIFSYLLLTTLAQTLDSLLKENRVNRNLVIVQTDLVDMGAATISDDVMQVVQELEPSVISRISPLIYRDMRIDGHIVQLRGAPLEDWETIHHLELREGGWPANNSEIAIGEGMARANGWDVGTVLRIYGKDFRVAGIFRAPGTAFASVWMPHQAALSLFAPRRDNQFLVIQAAPLVDAEALRARLQADGRVANGYAVYFEVNYIQRNTGALRDVASLMRVAGWIALLGVTFGVYNAAQLSLYERSREVGILRAVGFSAFSVNWILFVRSLGLGGVAYILGLLVAWSYAGLYSTAEPMFIHGMPFLFKVEPFQALWALGWVCVLAILGAWLATRTFLRQNVSDILRRPV